MSQLNPGPINSDHSPGSSDASLPPERSVINRPLYQKTVWHGPGSESSCRFVDPSTGANGEAKRLIHSSRAARTHRKVAKLSNSELSTNYRPERKRKRRRSANRAHSKFWPIGLFYVVLVPTTIGLGIWQGWTWWSWAQAPVQPLDMDPPMTVQIEIPPGTPTQVIGQNLEAAGIIRSSTAWDVWAHWLRWSHQIKGTESGQFQAGVYLLSNDQSLAEIAETILRGNVQESNFTIPEGWSLQQMAAYFEAQGFFSAQAFLAVAAHIPHDRFPWLPQDLPHLEGFLYPETYRLPHSEVTPEALIDQMLKQFEQVALPLYQSNDNRIGDYQSLTNAFTLSEWVTLASIVEKEAVLPQERKRIAGVLLNRLKIGMNLQVDPTVEYGLGIKQTPDAPLTLSEVQTPSPYNTYLNPGLPPTPIASPGLESLKAVLTPESTDYLYFVARYDGTHIFSQTLEDHEAAQHAIRDDWEFR